MKIKLIEYGSHWRYNIKEKSYTQEQFDYAFKYLDFDKLDKTMYIYIYFNNKKTEDWFKNIYIDNRWLDEIYKKSPLGYEWLKDNWGNGMFKIVICYQDKQELKIIVNKLINIELIRKNNEN